MPRKILRKMLQGAFSIMSFIVILNVTSTSVWDSGYFKIFPIVAAVFCGISTIMPGLISMGVSNQKESNIISNLLPALTTSILIFVLGSITQTYAVVTATSFFFGNTVGYLAWLLGDILAKRLAKEGK